jgi:DNA-binding XRE family transcriptional regulator
MLDKPNPPKGAEVRELRESLGLSQSQAAELVYSTLRSWQNWEAGDVGMHPAVWCWFRHQVESKEGPSSRARPAVKYVRRVISFWWNEKDQAIHVTTQGTAQPLHTTFPADQTSERWHRSMFDWLRKTLEASEKPAPERPPDRPPRMRQRA